jgi:hypothetical protein
MFVVTGRSWQRSVEVQRMEETRTSAWCDSPPSGGHELSRHKESRGTTKVQDGETCQTRKKDQGNGTYKEVRECTPKYKDVPVSADRCDYDVMTWTTARTPKEQGAEDAPRWPQVSLGRTGTAVGSEREGARSEKYTVSFTEEKTGKPASCDVAQPAWATFTKGAKYKGKVRVATGGLDCDALVK